MPIFKASTVVVMISLFRLAHSLSCHEGFNVSFSGIPFYYWAEHQCARDSECFVQEITSSIPNTNLKGNVLRFGGCVSMSSASHVTCEQLYEENSTLTIKNVFDILRGLDDKVEKVVEDIILDGDTHLGRFFSRGKGLEEFIAGVLEFLEALGYDKSKIEAPLNNLARAVVDDDTASMMNAGVELLTSAQVNNQATKMLSRALLHFVSQVVDGRTSLVLGCTVYGPGLLYPILRLTIASDELQDGYIAVAKGFINLDIEQPQAAVAENYQDVFLSAVVLLQSLISAAHPESRDKAYQTTKKVIQVYKEANLDSPLPEEMMKVADLLDKYVKKMTSLPSCGANDYDCALKKMHAKLSLRYEMIEEVQEIFGGSKWIGKETDGNEELESLIFEPLTDLIDSIQKWNFESLVELFDILQPKVENLADKLGHQKIEFRKSLSPDTCSHLRCTESLCNSHEAFSSQKNSDKSSILKNEL